MGVELPAELIAALGKIHRPADWVHLSTVGKDGGPHVAPMILSVGDGVLLFSLTGKQKKRNLERDPRAAVSVADPSSLGHVIAWGTIKLRHDDEAQVLWETMMREAFGEDGANERARELSLDGTSLGVMTVHRHRIYGID